MREESYHDYYSQNRSKYVVYVYIGEEWVT